MGNRTFLYTTDKLPNAIDGDEPAPEICHAVGSGNNSIPQLWRVLFSSAVGGPAQDCQQVFLPSVCGGIYAERGLAERRLFTLLEFIARHPLLPDPVDFQRQVNSLRQYLATLSGLAYSADLNEYFMMETDYGGYDEDDEDDNDDGDPADSPEAGPDSFMQQCARTWQQAERAMLLGDYDSIEELYDINPNDPANSLGFDGWEHEYFSHYANQNISATFDEYCAARTGASDAADALAGAGHGGYAPAQTAEGFGVVDRSGAFVIPAIYSAIEWEALLNAWIGSAANGEKTVFFADGRPWFSGAYDHIHGLAFEGDALVEKNCLTGSIRRDGTPGIPMVYANIALLLEPTRGAAGTAPALYAVTSNKKKRLVGACLPDGELRAPLAFDTIAALPVTPGAADGSAPGLPQLFVVSRRHGRVGVWSADEQKDLLASKYDRICSFQYQQRVALLAHEEDSGYVIADAQGKLLTAQAYDWLYHDRYEAAEARHLFSLSHNIGLDWSRGKPVYGWRDEQGWRIHPDGREESELAYQLRLAFDDAAPAIAPPSALKGLLNIVRRQKTPVLAGATNADACKVLGDIYAEGLGVDVDPVKAFGFYATAAAGGNREAQYLYGYHLMEGLGCEEDAAAARRQFEALVPENKMALNCLAYLYECRLGDEIDPVRARALYIEAAQGGAWGCALAQKNAGNCYLYGIGGAVDKKIALEYYEWAANDSDFPPRPGNADACRLAAGLYGIQAGLADCYAEPGEVKQPLQRTIYYYREMLDYGREEAHVQLARCYLGEFGGEQNLDAARRHLRRALGYTWHEDEAQELWDQYQLG